MLPMVLVSSAMLLGTCHPLLSQGWFTVTRHVHATSRSCVLTLQQSHTATLFASVLQCRLRLMPHQGLAFLSAPLLTGVKHL